MWLVTENPWPLILALSVVAVGMLAAWYARRDNRLLIVTGGVILLAVGVWEFERRVVTERERLAAEVLELRDAVQKKNLAGVFALFSNSDPKLKLLATAGLALVEFEDAIRVTALETKLSSNDSRGETQFRANVSLKVAGYGSMGRQPTLWSLGWRKEGGEWRIVRVRRFHPLSRKEMSPLAQGR